jgi:outer membrane protein assembly factor BamB
MIVWAIVSARRRHRGPTYSVYVSEDGRRLRRQRVRRRQSALLIAIVLVVVLGVLVGSGVAQRAWHGIGGSGDRAQAGGQGSGPDAADHAAPVATTVAAPEASSSATPAPGPPIVAAGDGVKVSTFLGDETRRLYGLGPPPKKLKLIWKTYVGGGLTSPVAKVTKKHPNQPWYGSGWTGQPVIVRDKGTLYLLWGAFDHMLHKIVAETGKVVWKYDFHDIIKSSPTVIENPRPEGKADKYLVMAGSRRGYPSSFTDLSLAPYRAVSFRTGKEVWRLPVPLTASYSRDVDGSGFLHNNRLFAGVESGWFYKLNPWQTKPWNGYRTPAVIAQRLLLGDPGDASAHGGNLVLEASPSLLDDVVYVSSGSGHVYGMRRTDLKVVWDYRTGSDMDGTAVPTESGRLLVAVEKQYIQGHGGVLMLDPKKDGAKAVKWFFPTGDRHLADWAGGVIGSVAVNDTYDPLGRRPRLASFMAIDGNLYVVAQDATTGSRVPGPNLDGPYKTPRLVAKLYVGGSISTPIMVDDSIVAAGYDNSVHLYKVKWKRADKGDEGALESPDGHWFTAVVVEKSSFAGGGAFESAPVMWKGRVFIGCRDGSLYCLGDR